MKLYLLRHGDALPASLDPERPLSGRGREQIRQVAALARERGIGFRQLFTSPLVRARESASLLVAAAPLSSEDGLPDPAEGLLPNDPVAPWARRLATLGEDAAIVGHNPFLEELAECLIPGVRMVFETGTLLALERSDVGTWRLRYRIDPTGASSPSRSTA